MNSKIPSTTPAIVTEHAARSVPRLLMIGLVLVYGLMGFVGREPYKPLELSQLGWFFLSVDHGTAAKANELGFDPLLHPIDFASSLGWLTHRFDSKFIFLIFQLASWSLLCSTLLLTWLGAKRFASLSAAQPVTFAFGGEAKANSYATAIADSSVLALIASLGFSQFGHEFSPFLLQICCVSGLMLATSVTQGSGLMRLLTRALPLILLAQVGAPLLAMMLCFALVSQSLLTRSAGRRDREILLHFILSLMIIAWLIGVHWNEIRYLLSSRHRDEIGRVLKLMAWFTWPIWPMALWTMWKWRQHWWSTHASVHLLSPILLFTATLIHAFWLGHNDRWYFLTLPPLALLAALALPTLTRSVSSVIDWFTMLLFSGSGLLIWLFWLAGVAGWPPEIVARLEKSIPQFQLTFAPIHFLVAMMASIAWLWLVMWRTGRHRDSLWKSLALPAGGAATCWILLTSLWLPYLNQTRSMAELGNQLKTSLPLNSCVIAWNLNNEQISALYYYGKISHLTTVTDISSDEKCSLLLANYNSLQLNNEAIDNNVWIQSELLIGNRLNNDDDLMIFHRR